MKLKYCDAPHPRFCGHPRARLNGCCYFEPGHTGEHLVGLTPAGWGNYWTDDLKHALSVRTLYLEILDKAMEVLRKTMRGRSIVKARIDWERVQHWILGLKHIHGEIERHRAEGD